MMIMTVSPPADRICDVVLGDELGTCFGIHDRRSAHDSRSPFDGRNTRSSHETHIKHGREVITGRVYYVELIADTGPASKRQHVLRDGYEVDPELPTHVGYPRVRLATVVRRERGRQAQSMTLKPLVHAFPTKVFGGRIERAHSF